MSIGSSVGKFEVKEGAGRRCCKWECSVKIMVCLNGMGLRYELDSFDSIKANSHIPCRSHAAPTPFPCHAVPLRV
jgi:hypothetical protein